MQKIGARHEFFIAIGGDMPHIGRILVLTETSSGLGG